MAVTRTIRYKGSYQDAAVLRLMLEVEGVRVELRRKGRRRLRRAQRRVEKRQVLVERAELLERQDKEERELLQRLEQEPPELHKRHARALQELDRRHDGERLEKGMPPRGADADQAPLVSLRQMLDTDVDQVGIKFRSTGAAAVIADTAAEFRKAAPASKVKVRGEPRTVKHGRRFRRRRTPP
jgi:hypothetical protein